MSINKEIFRLAIPNILSNISVPLIASVDTGLMGHTSAAHLAAIGSASMIFNFLYWNFGFLRMGTTGMVAQAHGAQNEEEKSRIFYQSVIVALTISFILLGLHSVISELSFDLMNLFGENRVYAAEYFNIRIWDAPATIMLYVIMAWFFGNQNAIIPFIITLLVNLVNITLSVYLVKVQNMDITGVALGSVIANYSGMIFGLFMIFYKKQLISVPFEKLTQQISRFIHVNKNIFIRTLLLSIVFAFLYSQAATYGEVMIAVNVVMLQFLNWMSYGVDGFAYAAESLVGKYKGSKEEQKLTTSIKTSMLWGGIFAILFSIIYFLGFDYIARIFTNDAAVLESISPYKYWIIFVPIVAFASYIWDGIFVGLTASKAMRNTMIVSFIIYMISYYATKQELGYWALILALTLYLITRGITQTWLYIKRGTQLE